MKIAIYCFEGITMFHMAVPQMVFGEVTRQGFDKWNVLLFGDTEGSIFTSEGYEISGLHSSESIEDADIIVIPSWFEDLREAPESLIEKLTAGHSRGAKIVGLCLGAVPIAQSHILDGRRAVTHWQAFDQLKARNATISWDNSVLYVDHGDVMTSAGTAAGLDACLHLVRSELGAEAALHVSRSLVIAPHRDGGQAQFVERPIAPTSGGTPISAVMQWADEHLEDVLTVERLAEVARMSTRTFLRAFQSGTGLSPAVWVRRRRLDESRRLLETTDYPVEQIAYKVGFGGSATLRQNFKAEFGIAPAAYRSRFSMADKPTSKKKQP
ncbi:MAG: helix-turn-helix domain-containing protein [Tissierellia bacterium]|nr:helix-turn-helix domain-containing protein [Tissierellia bacterium]